MEKNRHVALSKEIIFKRVIPSSQVLAIFNFYELFKNQTFEPKSGNPVQTFAIMLPWVTET